MPTSTLVPQHDLSLFDGCGEMGQLCREFPWELSPIGAPVTWPASLRIVVRTVLESQFPMCVLCGSDLVQIYNDAFRTVLGSKHPQALGKASANSWREIWTDVAPLLASAQSGEASVLRSGARFVIERDVGAPEETFFALVPSPVRDEDGRVVAVLGVAMETTSKVL
ncbi:MAG: PAS domain-containing protein, partial [Gemmatimonas sp.]